MVSLNRFLSVQLKTGQLTHAYIFTGAYGSEQAFALAAALECQSPQEDGSACGSCAACRNMLAGTHPDVSVISPQGATHKVESMRDLVASAGRSRMFGKYKVFILEDAEKMSNEAANTLLKLLEEPVADTVLILLSQLPDQFLPTILSRCQLFSFNDEGADDAVSDLEIFAEAEAFLKKLPKMPLFEVLQYSRLYEGERDKMRAFYFALLQLFHSSACGKNSVPMPLESILDSAAAVERAIDLIAHGANQKLLSDVLFLRLRQNCM